MDFSETVKAQIEGRKPRLAPLQRFDFLSGTQRYWPGFGPITAGGHVWLGTQGLSAIGEITASSNGSAPEQTFTLSGVDASFVAAAQAAKPEYYGRLAFIYFQFFDENWQTLDSPVPFWWGRMYSLIAREVPAEKTRTRALTLSAETIFASRRRPRNSYYTDRDQQSRFPGDRACEHTLGMQSKLITFPDY
jgi:hypothetical protein